MTGLQLGAALILFFLLRKVHSSQWCIEVSPDIDHAPFKCPNFASETSTSSKYNRVENYLSVGASYLVGFQGSLVLLGVETFTFLGARAIFYLVEIVKWLWNAIKTVFHWVTNKAFITFANWWYVEAWSRTIGALARSIGNSFFEGVACVVLLVPAFPLFCLWALLGGCVIVIGVPIGLIPIPFLLLIIPVAAILTSVLGIVSVVPVLVLVAIIAIISVIAFLIYMVLAIGLLQLVIVLCAIALCFFALALASSILVGVMGCTLFLDNQFPASSQGCCSARVSILDRCSLVVAWLVNYCFQVLVFFSDLVVVHWSLQAMLSDRGLDVATLPRGIDMDIAIDIEKSLGHAKGMRNMLSSALEFTKVTFRNAIDLPEFLGDWFDFQCSSMVATYTSSYVLAGWVFLYKLEGFCLKQKLANYYTGFQDLRVSRIFAKPCLYLFLRMLELILSCASTVFFWFITRRHQQPCDYVSDWTMTILTHYILFGGTLLGMLVLAPRILLGTSSSGSYQAFDAHRIKVGDFWKSGRKSVAHSKISNKSHGILHWISLLKVILSPTTICHHVWKIISNPRKRLVDLIRFVGNFYGALFFGSGSLLSEHVSLYLLFVGVWTQRTFALAGRKDRFWNSSDKIKTEEFCVITAKCAGAALFLFPCGPLLARLMENTNKGWIVRRKWNDGTGAEKKNIVQIFVKAKERMVVFVQARRKLLQRQKKLEEQQKKLERFDKDMTTIWERFRKFYEDYVERPISGEPPIPGDSRFDKLKPSLEILKKNVVGLKIKMAQMSEEKEKPSEKDMLVWESVKQNGEICKSPKDRAVVVWNGCFYLLGGSTQFDVHCFDTRDRTWTPKFDVSGDKPSARSSYSSVVCGDSIFIFGGIKENVQGEWYAETKNGVVHAGSIRDTILTLQIGEMEDGEDAGQQGKETTSSPEEENVGSDIKPGEMGNGDDAVKQRTETEGSDIKRGVGFAEPQEKRQRQRAIRMLTSKSFECKIGAAELQDDGSLIWTKGEFQGKIWRRSEEELYAKIDYNADSLELRDSLANALGRDPNPKETCKTQGKGEGTLGALLNFVRRDPSQAKNLFPISVKKDGACLDELFEFRIPCSHWTQINTLNKPCPRFDHSCVEYDGDLYVHGGSSSKNSLRDLHKFAVKFRPEKDLKWETLEMGDRQCARSGHTAVVYNFSSGRSCMFTFGGVNGFLLVDPLYEYDFREDKWSSVTLQGGYVPSSRYCHSAVVFGSRMFVFGGRGSNRQEVFADLCTFDFNDKSWVAEDASKDRPSARSHHTSVMHGGRMYSWGGLGSNGEPLSDMHRIALPQLPLEQHREEKSDNSGDRVNVDADDGPAKEDNQGLESNTAGNIVERLGSMLGAVHDQTKPRTSGSSEVASPEKTDKASPEVDDEERLKQIEYLIHQMSDLEAYLYALEKNEGLAMKHPSIDDVWTKGDPLMLSGSQLKNLIQDTLEFDEYYLVNSDFKKAREELLGEKDAHRDRAAIAVLDNINLAAAYRQKKKTAEDTLDARRATLNVEMAELGQDAKKEMLEFSKEIENNRYLLFSATNEHDSVYDTPPKECCSVVEKLFAVLKFLVMAIVPWIADQKVELPQWISQENSVRALTIRLGVFFLTVENLASIPKLWRKHTGTRESITGRDMIKAITRTPTTNLSGRTNENRAEPRYELSEDDDLKSFHLSIDNLYTQVFKEAEEAEGEIQIDASMSSLDLKICVEDIFQATHEVDVDTAVTVSGKVIRV